MKPHPAAWIAGSFLFAVLVVVPQSCQLWSVAGGSTPVAISSSEITLAWDPPTTAFPSAPLAISKYKVFIRKHSGGDWSLCGTVPASGNPELRLLHKDIGDGAFDFAVEAVNDARGASTLHLSLDASAEPYGGWHLVWSGTDE
jgi:hypothetical protein